MNNSTTSSTILTSADILLDNSLIRVMRPHQIDAANFLIKRLLGENTVDIIENIVKVSDASSDKNDTISMKKKSNSFISKGALSDTEDEDGDEDRDDNDDSPDLQSDSDFGIFMYIHVFCIFRYVYIYIHTYTYIYIYMYMYI
jgi:hypothetical protein